MKNSQWPAFMIFGFFLLSTLTAGGARSDDATQPSWSPKAAANYLDGRAEWWLKWSGAARGQGTACAFLSHLDAHCSGSASPDRSTRGICAGMVERRLIDNLKKRVENWEKIVEDDATTDKDPFKPYYSDKEEESLGTESVLNALILVNADARREKNILSGVTKKALGHLWEQQQENGSWLWLDFGLNPWEKDGAYYGTSLAAVAVGLAGKSHYDGADVRAKVALLRQYLKAHYPNQPLHHRVVALWAASRLPGVLTEETKQELIAELLNIQESDGGWSLPKLGKNTSKSNPWASRTALTRAERSATAMPPDLSSWP